MHLRAGIKNSLLGIPGGRTVWAFLAGARSWLGSKPFPQTTQTFTPGQDGLGASLLPPRLAIVLPAPDPGRTRQLEAASPYFVVTDASQLSHLEPDYVYAPASLEGMLSLNHLRNALLALTVKRLDFFVVSHGLEEPPALKIVSPMNNTIFSAEAFESMGARHNSLLPAGSRGRVARLLPGPALGHIQRLERLEELGLGPLEIEGDELVRPGRRQRLAHDPPPKPAAHLPLFTPSPGNRKTIFILPIFMAVGGAERNLIEVLKPLKEEYSFIILVTEKVSLERGSLNHQILPYCDASFDLGELSPQDDHFAFIDALATSYSPRLVFLANGSPWLAQNLPLLRNRFADVPIVDQQCYDAHHGWIEHYGQPGFQALDRYIAINSHILGEFKNRFGIPDAKIDLIYHAIDTDRFNLHRAEELDRQRIAQRFGLDLTQRRVAMIGRLTDQKRPLDFLELARRCRADFPDIQFLLVGAGELAQQCDQFIQTNALPNVRRIPFVEDLSELLPFIDGLIFCSAYEGLPIAMLEALAMGVPILSTDVGDIPLLLDHYGTGHVVRPVADPQALHRAFLTWVRDLDDLRARAREAAPSLQEHFSAKRVARQYEACWKTAWRRPPAVEARTRSRSSASVRLPPISVVIPTYNRGQLLIETLRNCVRLSGGVELEFVVIDDGSTDDTAQRLTALAERMPNLVWKSIPNGGPGQARNLGASMAKYDVILFMGDDIQPVNDQFFRVHAELHAKYPETNLAILGKIVWPNQPDVCVNFVMAHIQGHGGEQFGYADLTPYSFLDWRFFYTAQISVKKALVGDWMIDGFDRSFTLAAYEDPEFAYRMFKRPNPLRIFYTAAAIGSHHHHFTLNDFVNRQISTGRMAKVFFDLHPEAAPSLMVDTLIDALETPVTRHDDIRTADYLSIIEGIKSWGRLIESDQNLGSEYWHNDLLYALFELCYAQGFILNWTKPDANFCAAYRTAVARFVGRMKYAANTELAGSALDHQFRRFGGTTKPTSPQTGLPRFGSSLRRWASSKPRIVRLYRRFQALRARLH